MGDGELRAEINGVLGTTQHNMWRDLTKLSIQKQNFVVTFTISCCCVSNRYFPCWFLFRCCLASFKLWNNAPFRCRWTPIIPPFTFLTRARHGISSRELMSARHNSRDETSFLSTWWTYTSEFSAVFYGTLSPTHHIVTSSFCLWYSVERSPGHKYNLERKFSSLRIYFWSFHHQLDTKALHLVILSMLYFLRNFTQRSASDSTMLWTRRIQTVGQVVVHISLAVLWAFICVVLNDAVLHYISSCLLYCDIQLRLILQQHLPC